MSRMVEGSSFDIVERFDEDGALRLALHGGLDIAVADALTERLSELERREIADELTAPVARLIDIVGVRSNFWPRHDWAHPFPAIQMDQSLCAR